MSGEETSGPRFGMWKSATSDSKKGNPGKEGAPQKFRMIHQPQHKAAAIETVIHPAKRRRHDTSMDDIFFYYIKCIAWSILDYDGFQEVLDKKANPVSKKIEPFINSHEEKLEKLTELCKSKRTNVPVCDIILAMNGNDLSVSFKKLRVKFKGNPRDGAAGSCIGCNEFLKNGDIVMKIDVHINVKKEDQLEQRVETFYIHSSHANMIELIQSYTAYKRVFDCLYEELFTRCNELEQKQELEGDLEENLEVIMSDSDWLKRKMKEYNDGLRVVDETIESLNNLN